MSATVGPYILIPALHEFYERYPDIQLDLAVSDRPIDLVVDNVDCVIRAGHVSDASLVVRRVGDFRFVTCAAPLARHGSPAHPRDLDAAHRTVGYFSARTGKVYPFDFERDGERLEVVGRRAHAVNDGNAYLAAGLAGLDVIQIASFAAAAHLRTGALVPVLDGWTSECLPAQVVYPPNRYVTAKLRAFIDWVAALFERHPEVRRRATPQARATASAAVAAARVGRAAGA